MTTLSTAAPVANPTWYGQIRDMFTPQDRSHMKPQGLDLASYDEVVKHAGEIYQEVALGRMPPNAPWSSDWVGTFLNWMHADFPRGIPPAARSFARFGARFQSDVSAPRASRIRKDVTKLDAGELDLLKRAFSAIMAMDPRDANSYFVQAGFHWYPAPNTYCMHHVPGYNPWHRAYLLSFENALRSVPGCENVVLPYWDITTPFPDVLKLSPFDQYVLPEAISPEYPKGYTTSRFPYDQIALNLVNNGVTAALNRAMTKTDWEDFHGAWSNANNNTIIAAHDSAHDSIGPTMQDPGAAAFDPVFWFFHCNWDRLFWAWQKRMAATDLHGLLTTIRETTDPVSYQIFTDASLETLAPFTTHSPTLTTIATADSIASLDVDYDDPPAASITGFLAKTQLSVLASERFAVNTDRVNVRVSGVNRLTIPGSFLVHLQKDGHTIASTGFFQPVEVKKCASCVSNAIVHFDFELPLQAMQGGKLGVWVEPVNKTVVGDRFPQKLMGNPTIDVHLLLQTE